jgi:hypothetical protein
MPMVFITLDMNKDQFRPKNEDEELLETKISYLSAIRALMYVKNCTKPDIAIAVNLLARHSAPTKRYNRSWFILSV